MAQCAACHGDRGRARPPRAGAGGRCGLAHRRVAADDDRRDFWPYATTLYDYIHRTMPFDKPQSLKPDEM